MNTRTFGPPHAPLWFQRPFQCPHNHRGRSNSPRFPPRVSGLLGPSPLYYVRIPSSGPERGMQIRKGIIEAIGNTPLIKLARASEATGCTILGKAEFMNPGGSVKDRAG